MPLKDCPLSTARTKLQDDALKYYERKAMRFKTDKKSSDPQRLFPQKKAS